MRHHSDTIIVGRDREIAVPRPPQLRPLLLNFVGVENMPFYFRSVLRHCVGRITAEERTYIPAEQFPKVFFKARIYFLIYAAVIGLARLHAQHPAADVRRPAQPLRLLADGRSTAIPSTPGWPRTCWTTGSIAARCT